MMVGKGLEQVTGEVCADGFAHRLAPSVCMSIGLGYRLEVYAQVYSQVYVHRLKFPGGAVEPWWPLPVARAGA